MVSLKCEFQNSSAGSRLLNDGDSILLSLRCSLSLRDHAAEGIAEICLVSHVKFVDIPLSDIEFINNLNVVWAYFLGRLAQAEATASESAEAPREKDIALIATSSTVGAIK